MAGMRLSLGAKVQLGFFSAVAVVIVNRTIEQRLQQYEQSFARLLTVPSEAHEEIQRVSQELSEVGQRISRLAEEIAEAKWVELTMHADDADRVESVAKGNMGIILGFTGISSLLLGLYLPPKIVVPIRKLTQLIKRAQAVHSSVRSPSRPPSCAMRMARL
jgi:hypothetical protein